MEMLYHTQQVLFISKKIIRQREPDLLYIQNSLSQEVYAMSKRNLTRLFWPREKLTLCLCHTSNCNKPLYTSRILTDCSILSARLHCRALALQWFHSKIYLCGKFQTNVDSVNRL